MTLRLSFLGLAALTASSLSPICAANPVPTTNPIWCIRVYPNQLQSGVAADLLKSLGAPPLTGSFNGIDASALESFEVIGVDSSASDKPFFADLQFQPGSGAAAKVLDATAKQENVVAEDLAGHRAVHFAVPAKKSAEVWLAQSDNDHIVLGQDRSTVEAALNRPPNAPDPLGERRKDELVGGIVDVARLKNEIGDSDLLAMIQHLEFHIDSSKDMLHLVASATMADDRGVKRAARMIEGIITIISLQDEDSKERSLDERVRVTAKGGRLELDVNLDAKESQELIQSLTDGLLRGHESNGHKLHR